MRVQVWTKPLCSRRRLSLLRSPSRRDVGFGSKADRCQEQRGRLLRVAESRLRSWESRCDVNDVGMASRGLHRAGVALLPSWNINSRRERVVDGDGRPQGLLMTLVESYANPVCSSLDQAARYLEFVFGYDQRERGAQIGKLQSGAHNGKITNNAGALVAAVFNLRRLRNAIARRNPGFDD